MSRRNSAVVAVDADHERRLSIAVPDLKGLTHDANKASESERNMTLLQGIRLYPKAVAWSAFLSAAIIMEGFDKVLINSLYAVPAFKERFGSQLADGSYEVSAAWQAGLSNGAFCGEFCGLLLNGIIAEKFGYRKTMIGALAAVNCIIFIVFFAQNIVMLLCGLILCGIPWGVFQTLTTTYAAEVVPVPLRPILTTYVNLCWVIGQFLASGVLKGVAERPDQWAYRIPYALQWLWPTPLIIGIIFAPESPWWLVRQDRDDDAKKMLMRLTTAGKNPDFNADETIAMMRHTNELEKAVSAGTSYLDCFRGTDFRRTEIAAMTWFTQAFCGAALIGYSTYFFQQAGLSVSNSFSMSLGQYGIGAIGVFVAWALIPRVGRRTLYLWGDVGMIIVLLVIGGMGVIPKGNVGAQWGIGALLLVFACTYNITVGPVCYAIVAEIPSTRLRQKTVVLARNFYNLSMVVSNVLTPRMLNPGAWNWGAKTGFFYAGTCLCCYIWALFRLPEAKGRTYGELDMLFEKRVPARQFATTVVEPLHVSDTESEFGEKKRASAHVEHVSAQAVK
ncbi:maltose permease MAL61 [Dothidotthia symphoricarpi CBS 119687]|uniref:Maltose permease MAL61 n=1 Tax=Dothidotthia symphoricarpi CBS 119687 TaxID=1392245 RepID=A0A6A6AUS5_9PLEO|nr:maltose permease MAL61 [Dothidotthia symphoricarpi CBS 119687]KAF2134291.1 maltose permease MAL61 [Dothidotthia symphoricarpi CBS 119687]